MKLLSKQEFVERHGEPTNFVFKGQCYIDPTSETKCSLCGKQIRSVYVLKNSKDRSTPTGQPTDYKILTGPECFVYWEKWNSPLFRILLCSSVWLRVQDEAEQREIKAFSHRKEVQDTIRQWREIKRTALQVVRSYRRTAKKDWLPEPLYVLQAIASKQPSPTATHRWYSNRIREFQAGIQKVSS